MTSSSEVHAPSSLGWKLLRATLAVESLLGALLVVNTFVAFLAASEEPLGARLSLVLAVVAALAWVVITLIGAVRGRGWSRASALTLHTLLFAAATGVLQGIFGEMFFIGALMLVLSFAGFFSALFAPAPQRDADGG